MAVRDVFVGKKIFITGGSGFVGKVLIEKLLRSCPGVEKIYVLIREKKGKSAAERLEQTTQDMLFQKLKDTDPEALKKLVPMAGDVTKLKLGMTDEDWNFLIKNVNIIFNAAASVRFDDSLKYSILINVRSTREVTSLALECENLSVFIHISTMYCQSDKKVVDEIIYPSHADWRIAIKLAEESDEMQLQSLTLKYIDPLPNTYTFAKSLAEHVVNDQCSGKIKAFILRPSVVISIIEDPIRGWVDNLNGPVGLLVAGGKGLLRTVWGDAPNAQDYIPVDLCIRTIILATREKILNGNKDVLEVYNCSQYDRRPIPVGRVVEMGRNLIWDSPFTKVLWYPRFFMTSCWYWFYVQVLLFHMLPAVFLDLGLAISGKKKMFVKIQRKIYIANVVLEHFISNQWNFKNKRAINLNETISSDDWDDFNIEKYNDMTDKEIYEFFKSSKVGVMLYTIKEEFTPEKSRKMIWRLWVLDMFIRTIFFSLVAWLLLAKIKLPCLIGSYIYNYFAAIPV